MPFSTGKGAAIFANIRLIPLWQPRNKFFALCSPCRRFYFFVSCTASSKANILHDSFIKEKYILENNSKVFE